MHPGGVPGYPGTGGPPQYPGAPQYQGPVGGPPPQHGGYPQNHPNAALILVLGILGLVLCAPVGVVAWVMGGTAIKEIDSSGAFYANRGTVQAGRVLGIIATILLIIQVAALVFFVVGGGMLAFVDVATG